MRPKPLAFRLSDLWTRASGEKSSLPSGSANLERPQWPFSRFVLIGTGAVASGPSDSWNRHRASNPTPFMGPMCYLSSAATAAICVEAARFFPLPVGVFLPSSPGSAVVWGWGWTAEAARGGTGASGVMLFLCFESCNKRVEVADVPFLQA